MGCLGWLLYTLGFVFSGMNRMNRGLCGSDDSQAGSLGWVWPGPLRHWGQEDHRNIIMFMDSFNMAARLPYTHQLTSIGIPVLRVIFLWSRRGRTRSSAHGGREAYLQLGDGGWWLHNGPAACLQKTLCSVIVTCQVHTSAKTGGVYYEGS